MGQFLSRLYNLFGQFSSSCESRILMLGLDAAGKTTILYKVKLNETVSTIPTIGFNVETVSPVKGVTFTVWDVGGQERLRKLWVHYYTNASGILFVVDSSDRERIEEVKSELFHILESDELRGVPLVIIANKQDLPNALKPSEIVERLQLHSLHGREWHIQAACATTADGIYEAFESMSTLVKDFHKHRTVF